MYTLKVMRILFIGDIIGKAGLNAVKAMLAGVQKELNIDFTIAGAAFTTRGFGLGKGHALYLKKLGIQVLTGSDMILSKQDLVANLATMPFVLRAANFPVKTTPGRGFAYYKVKNASDEILGILCLQGQTGCTRCMPNNPFYYTFELLEKLKQHTAQTVVCFHAATTAEKQSMAAYLAGKTGAVIGYGTRALTSDAKIIQHTACITDCGFTGARFSAAGLDSAVEIERLISQRPLRSHEAESHFLVMDIVMVELDEQGHAMEITPMRRYAEGNRD